MFDRNSSTAGSDAQAHEHASFRARLLARESKRPQSTLAIDSGIVYRPGASSSEHTRRAAEAVRDEIRRRQAESAPAPVAAAVVAPQPEPAAPPPSDAELVSVIEDIAARKAEERARAEEERRRRLIAPVVTPAVTPRAAEARAEAEPEIRTQVAGRDEQVGIGTRIGDISQIAFAGLAVLGLAGLSVMAAENALNSSNPLTPTEGADKTPGPAVTGGASAVALSTAVPEEPQAWFNYQGVADLLAERKAAMDAAEQAAREEAERQARVQAANAIAEAEAARVAEEQKAAAEAAEQARLAEEAERARLAEAEASRVAEEEALRIAEAEAARVAAEEAEARRLADLEAKRQAEAEAEAQRLADLEAQRLAKLEAERKAAEEAARREAFELAKAQEAEKLRLAALKAQAEADAAEARRIEAAAAKAKADRLAAEKLAAEQAAADKAAAERLAAQQAAARKAEVAAKAPAPIVFTAYDGPVPSAASYKPAGPKILTSAPVAADAPLPAGRPAVAPLKPDTAGVRSFDAAASPQTPEAFLASRMQRAAKAPMATADLAAVQQAFVTLLNTGADGSQQTLTAPDGQAVSVLLERTVSREAGQSTVRTVTYTPGVNAVTRVVTQQAPVTVSVMCRDVAYAFAGGQERGRFAACQAPDGGWTLARATDLPAMKSASLPNSAG